METQPENQAVELVTTAESSKLTWLEIINLANTRHAEHTASLREEIASLKRSYEDVLGTTENLREERDSAERLLRATEEKLQAAEHRIKQWQEVPDQQLFMQCWNKHTTDIPWVSLSSTQRALFADAVTHAIAVTRAKVAEENETLKTRLEKALQLIVLHHSTDFHIDCGMSCPVCSPKFKDAPLFREAFYGITAPPTAEPAREGWIELTYSDIPPGSVVRRIGWDFQWRQVVAVSTSDLVVHYTASAKVYTFKELFDNYEISRDHGLTWLPCKKLKTEDKV